MNGLGRSGMVAVVKAGKTHYNRLGQVISGKRFWQDGTPVAGQQFEYAFDDIGNRRSTGAGGDASGGGLRNASYTANRLNQYSQRDVPGVLDILGIANPTAAVTVNGSAAYRKGDYFDYALPVANSAAPQYAAASVTSSYPPGQTSSGSVFVPKTPELFAYDADGNLTNDGRWTFTWDAENRLVQMLARTAAGPQQLLRFEYDWQGRRVHKQVWDNTGGTNNPSLDQRFVYDGWNLIAAPTSDLRPPTSFLWGLDLSGSLQGAGGVGGLLRVGAGTTNSFAAFDGNGNVIGLTSAADGAPMAQYEYGPFGELLRTTGPMAKVNPFRFSTKFQDDETDLLYYGYRYYNPSTGRWIGRDPVGEEGGNNIYEFCANNAISFSDRSGLNFDVWCGAGPAYNNWTGGQIQNSPSPNQTQQRVLSSMLTGNGGPFAFGPNDPWTKAIQQSSHVSEARLQIKHQLARFCLGRGGRLSGAYNFDLNDLAFWDQAARLINDAISWLTDGHQGTAPEFLFGSYRLGWNAAKHDCRCRAATIVFFGSDVVRLGSATRIPGTRIGLPDQPWGPAMPGQNVPISWTWSESIGW